jgi:hypothetical protein
VIRTNLIVVANGKTQEEIENKTKEIIAIYLNCDPSEVEDKADIEIGVHVGEEGPGEYYFGSSSNVRLK